MGSFLWSDEAIPDLAGLRQTNQDLLAALGALAHTSFEGQRRPIDWASLGAIELGSIYESLLELQPEITGNEFSLHFAPGNERKTTIATDDTTQRYFQSLIRDRKLVSIYDFENRGIFPAVDSRFKFSLLTCSARPNCEKAKFVFFAHEMEDLGDWEKLVTLSREEIGLLNPNTATAPIFRSMKDAILTSAVYLRHPVLIRENGENPWGIRMGTMFHMSNDSHLFRTKDQLCKASFELNGNVFEKGEKYLPLYEAKMIHHFNHRWATYEQDKKGLKIRDCSSSRTG